MKQINKTDKMLEHLIKCAKISIEQGELSSAKLYLDTALSTNPNYKPAKELYKQLEQNGK